MCFGYITSHREWYNGNMMWVLVGNPKHVLIGEANYTRGSGNLARLMGCHVMTISINHLKKKHIYIFIVDYN